MAKPGLIAAIGIGAAGALLVMNRTQNLKGKLKLNPQLPDRVNFENLGFKINFPIQVINQNDLFKNQ